MMRHLFSPSLPLALSLFLISGCGALTADEPPVADTTLTTVLVNLHLANARAELRSAPALPPGARDSILAQHGLDEPAFEAAMTYYAEHPEAYVDLYDVVLDCLSAGRMGGAPPGRGGDYFEQDQD